MTKHTIQYGVLLSVLTLTGGCVAFQPPERDGSPVPLPEQFGLYTEPRPDIDPWWPALGAPELSRLIETALGDNFSIRQAWARLQQAEALSRIARSQLYPDLNLDAGAGVTRREAANDAAPPLVSGTTETYSLGLSSQYEVDLWGRVRASTHATDFDARAGALDLQAAALSLSTRVADTWCHLVAQRAQLALLRGQLEANQKVMELIELRFRNALATALDVYQQRQVVAGTRAAIPPAEANAQVLMNELAVLVGEVPGTHFVVAATNLPALPALPLPGIPADLLANRPDVQAAGWRLQSADWRVSAAKADRLPAIRLSARGAYESGEWSSVFDNWLLNLTANLAGPIFDGGRRRGEVARTLAVAEERLAGYGETVAVAVKEVENALVQEQKQREHLAAVAVQVETSRKTYEESGSRYLNGMIDYLPVLTALVANQGLELSEVRKQYELISYRLALYRALGGDWMQTLTPMGLTQPEEIAPDE